MANNLTSNQLKDLFSKKSAWLGDNPPILADAIKLNPYSNYRASPTLHSRYEVAWMYEYNIFCIKSWPLIFDEMLRMLGEKGKLVTRTHNNEYGSIFELKSYLFRHHARKVSLDRQLVLEDGSTVSVIDITRLDYAMYSSKAWTIGIITNGSKNDNVKNLINKAIRLRGESPLEFIIVGPFDMLSDIHAPDLVKVICTDDWDDLPRITKKKYIIAQTAKYENVAIFHDRYQIGDDFFTGFSEFGYDFDFVTVEQRFENGEYFPGYTGWQKCLLGGYSPIFSKSTNILHENHYINGGLMIFKKNALHAKNFNPLLLHAEAEDIEISFQYKQSGIIPRLNIFSSAITTIAVPSSYMKWFTEVSENQKNIISPVQNQQQTRFQKRFKKLVNSIKKRVKKIFF